MSDYPDSPIIYRERWRGGSRLYIETWQRPLSVGFRPVYRHKRTTKIGGLRFNEVEQVRGRYDKDVLTMTCGGSMDTAVPAHKDAVDKLLRRVRPQELEQLRALESEIERLQVERRLLIEKAWQKGHVVTVKELTERADERRRIAEGASA